MGNKLFDERTFLPLKNLFIYLFIYLYQSGSVVKNPSAKQETWVQSLGWKDLLEKEMATHFGIFPGKSMDGAAGQATVHGSQELNII